jgi:hypothetical protein
MTNIPQVNLGHCWLGKQKNLRNQSKSLTNIIKQLATIGQTSAENGQLLICKGKFERQLNG